MTRRKSLIFVLLLAFLLGSVAGALPQSRVAGRDLGDESLAPYHQNYSFAVLELIMDVTVQPDASAYIVYDITFENYGSPIDIVDIGTPNDDYDLDEIEASINGQALTDIRTSEYIDTGVEIHLYNQAIPSGSTATLRVAFTAPDMVYADTTNDELASMQVTPTWFDSSLVRDSGAIEIRVHTLPGIESDEVLYQDEPFDNKVIDAQGRVMVIWRYEDVRATEAYRVGVSFPRRGMTKVIEITFWDLLWRWLGGAISLVLGCLPLAIPALVFFAIIRAIVRGSKPNYLPPIAQTEGGGIKRGLTAPEAAVLLELPLTKILGLVIFGMLEKGLIRQTDHDPLKLEVIEDFRVANRPNMADDASRAKFRRQVAQQKGTVIHAYELPFLNLIELHPNTDVSKLAVVKPMQALVDGVAAKMKGFDLSDTQDYYRRVIDRALEQAKGIGDVEQRQAYLDQYYPWVMMQPNYRPVMSMGNHHYWPIWARPSVSSAGSGAQGVGKAASGSGRSTTTFGDVSASFAGWAESTMGGMAAAILPTSLSKPSPVSSSSSRSGGSSCACACAGCACACACAGGGR